MSLSCGLLYFHASSRPLRLRPDHGRRGRARRTTAASGPAPPPGRRRGVGGAASITHDPTFALGHAALALLGHELCAAVDIGVPAAGRATRTPPAAPSASAATCTRSSRTSAATRPLVEHLAPTRATPCCSRPPCPTIAFAGVTEVPEEAWAIVERAIPAYGDDWWYTGLLAFVRQEQRRFDEAMDAVLPFAGRGAGRRPLRARPGARPLRDRRPRGRPGLDGRLGDRRRRRRPRASATSPGTPPCTSSRWATWTRSGGGTTPSCGREHGLGCRALVDTGSLLFRWAITPGAAEVPEHRGRRRRRPAATCSSARPPRSWACTRRSPCWPSTTGTGCARSAAGRRGTRTRPSATSWRRWPGRCCCWHDGRCSEAADALARALAATCPGSAGRDAQRESSRRPGSRALLRAGRFDEARDVLDDRLDRRRSPRDQRWRAGLPGPRSQAGHARVIRPLVDLDLNRVQAGGRRARR